MSVIDFLYHTVGIASNVPSLADISVVTAVGLCAMGLVPRLGPGRAAVLAGRSFFKSRIGVPTAKVELVSQLGSSLYARSNVRHGQFWFIRGPTGVGKTTLANSLAYRRCGVVRIHAASDEGTKQIVEQALRELTNMRLSFASLHASTVRVIWWYRRLFPFLSAPLVIIHTPERLNTKDFSALTGAVRILNAEYSVHVIVDGADSSVEHEAAGWQRSVMVNPFGNGQLESFPEYAELFAQLSNAGGNLDTAVFAILGGVPNHYEQLLDAVSLIAKKKDEEDDDEAEFPDAVKSFLLQTLTEVRMTFQGTVCTCPAASSLCEQFKHVDRIIYQPALRRRPHTDMVLRAQYIGHNLCLVPASPPMGFFLRHRDTLLVEGSRDECWEKVVQALKLDEAKSGVKFQ